MLIKICQNIIEINMTVKELIIELQKYDQELSVYVIDGNSRSCCAGEAISVKLDKDDKTKIVLVEDDMTVKELIKELSKVDPELDVVYSHSEYGIVDINVATTSLHIL